MKNMKPMCCRDRKANRLDQDPQNPLFFEFPEFSSKFKLNSVLVSERSKNPWKLNFLTVSSSHARRGGRKKRESKGGELLDFLRILASPRQVGH